VHVDAVAHATVLAIEIGHGIYNVADPNDYLSIERAQRELGFDAQFRVKDSS
jgi:nucleoside-diphosphate-sugar epimerase